jgi:hypothetical protein
VLTLARLSREVAETQVTVRAVSGRIPFFPTNSAGNAKLTFCMKRKVGEIRLLHGQHLFEILATVST